MSTMLVELYYALKEAGASEARARAAAESLVLGQDQLDRIEEQTGKLPKIDQDSDAWTRSSRSSKPRSSR